MPEEEKPNRVPITQGDVLRFLASRGYQVPRACPKCRFEPWDEGFDHPEAPFGEAIRDDHGPANPFQFACPNCGFSEEFNGEPLRNWKLGRS